MAKQTLTIFLEGLRSDRIYRRPQIKNCKKALIHLVKIMKIKFCSIHREACYMTILLRLRSLSGTIFPVEGWHLMSHIVYSQKRCSNQHTKIPSQNGVICSAEMDASDCTFIGIANMNRPIPIITSTTFHKIYENGQT